MDKSDLKKFVLGLAAALVIFLANMGWGWIQDKNTEHCKILWNINILRLKNDMPMLEELD